MNDHPPVDAEEEYHKLGMETIMTMEMWIQWLLTNGYKLKPKQ